MPYFRPPKASAREPKQTPTADTHAEHVLLPRIYPNSSHRVGLWPLALETEEADAIAHVSRLHDFQYFWREPGDFVPDYAKLDDSLDPILIDKIGAQLHVWGFDVFAGFRVSQESLALSALYRCTRKVERSDPLRRLRLPEETHEHLTQAHIRTVNHAILAIQGARENGLNPHGQITVERLGAFGLDNHGRS